MEVIRLSDGIVLKVNQYIKQAGSGEELVWCEDWYGRHTIGIDCEFLPKNQRTI